MEIIAIVNSKGGVGKTTTAVNLSAALHIIGKKVLCIDADAQCNSSRCFGNNEMNNTSSLYEVLSSKKDITDCIFYANENEESFHYIPSSFSLSRVEQELSSIAGREFQLKLKLEKIKSGYDFIIIDCPPQNGIITMNAMCAATSIVVPINCEVFALDGMGIITAKMEEVKQIINPNLKVLGYVMSRYDSRLSLHRQAQEQMKKLFGEKVFNSRIRTNIALAESPSQNMHIYDYAPDSNGAKDYMDLAKEISQRINQ